MVSIRMCPLLLTIASVIFAIQFWRPIFFPQTQFSMFEMDATEGLERMVQDPSDAIRPSTGKMNNMPDFSWEDIHSPGLPITTHPYNMSYKNPCWNEQDKLLCLPYFLIGGFAKCGTTELFSKLTFHPNIFHGSKEIHWWTRTRFSNNRTSEHYRNLFAGAAEQIVNNNPELITVDGTASTVWDNHHLYPRFGDANTSDPSILIAHMIHRQIPQAKCVVILRNPVKRFYSDYLYFHKNQQKSPEKFHEIAKDLVKRFNECLQNPLLTEMHCVYAKTEDLSRMRIGLYYFHLRTWLTAFPADQLMVVRLEDYSQNTATVLQDIFAFLGVKQIPREEIEDFIQRSKSKNTNKKSYIKHGEMLDKTKTMLTDFYRPYNERLAELLRDKHFLYVDL